MGVPSRTSITTGIAPASNGAVRGEGKPDFYGVSSAWQCHLSLQKHHRIYLRATQNLNDEEPTKVISTGRRESTVEYSTVLSLRLAVARYRAVTKKEYLCETLVILNR
jgi:hypothetical protein